MGSYKIIEILDDEQHLLLKELAKDMQRYFLIYTAIDLRLKKGPLTLAKLKVYRAEDVKYKSLIFVTTLSSNSNVPSLSTTWNEDEIENRDVGHLLSNIPDWDWNKQFSCYHSSWKMKIKFDHLFNNKFIVANTSAMRECYPAKRQVILTVTEEDLIIPKFSSNYKLDELPPTALSLMLSKWDFNFKDSVEGFSERIFIYGGASAVLNNRSVEGNSSSDSGVVAWAQTYMVGSIGMTYTFPEHRKNGLGGAITSTLAKKCLDEDRVAFVIVDEGNEQSLRLHKSLGFKFYIDAGFSMFLKDGTTIHDYLIK